MKYLNDINEKELFIEFELLYKPIKTNIEGKSAGIDSDLDVQKALTKMELRDDPNNFVADKYLSQLNNLEAMCNVPGGYVLQKQLSTPEDIQDSIKKYKL